MNSELHMCCEEANRVANGDAAAAQGFIERLLAQVDARPHAPALEMEATGEVWSYAALLALIEQMRAAFLALEVEPDDTVLLALPACPALVAAFYALASLSAIAVPVSEDLTAFELAPVLADAQPKGVVIMQADGLVDRMAPSTRFALLVAPARADDVPGLAAVAADPLGVRVAALADWQGQGSRLVPPVANPVVSCHFTYKGLGYPLGVLHRYESYGACIDSLIQASGVAPHVLHLAALPLHPIYALLASVLSPLSMGAHVLIVTGNRRRHVLSLLAQRQVVCASLVPPLYKLLLSQARGTGRARPALHPDLQLFTGGSALAPELMAEVTEVLGVQPWQGYGLSEALLVSSNFRGSEAPHSLGRPLHAGITVDVVDAQGQSLPPGRVGEIVVRSPSVMQGYLRRPRETARFLKGGAMNTGDLGHLDAQGYLHFDGRALPFTKCAAQMVDLAEIEAVLKRHPQVSDARAMVRVDPQRGEHVEAAVVLRPRTAVTGEALLGFLRSRLSAHKLPRSVQLFQRDLVAATPASRPAEVSA